MDIIKSTEKGRSAMTAQQEVGKLPADPHARLEIIEEALFALGTGQKRVEVRHGESWVRYHEGSIGYLEREAARLRAICNKRTAITIARTPTGRF